MRQISICFLGAAKRNVLLSQVVRAGTRMGIDVVMASVEASADDFYPISNLATIIGGPSFHNQEDFNQFASQQLVTFDLIIPLMDSACLALARSVDSSVLSEEQSLVSQKDFVEKTVDKFSFSIAIEFSQLPHIPNTPGQFPKIAKPKSGFGGRGIFQISEQVELSQIDMDKMIIQDKVSGKEVTLDAFYDRQGKFVQGIARERISVIDGEVNHLITRDLSLIEIQYLQNLGGIGARGPINMQLIGVSGDLKVLEINPRFGGGATASIEAGFDMPSMSLIHWIFGEEIQDMPVNHLEMVRSRQDFYRTLN
jgi:carbamoyl-phosphate synthase large subunit